MSIVITRKVKDMPRKDDTKNKILRMIMKNKATTYTQIKTELGITDAAVSRHISTLLKNKTIQFEKRGREKHYRLSDLPPSDKFELLVSSLGSSYALHYFLSNPSVEPKTPENVIDILSNQVSALFLYSVLLSIKTGKNWFEAFNKTEMLWNSLDLLSHALFRKNIDPDELQDLSADYEIFFKKVHQLSKNEKNVPLIDTLMECIEEKFPEQFEILEEKYDKLASKNS